MKITSEQLTDIIDTVKIAVDKSWVGEVATYGGTPDKLTKTVNQVAFTLYTSVLIQVLNKMGQVELEPPAPASIVDLHDPYKNEY